MARNKSTKPPSLPERKAPAQSQSASPLYQKSLRGFFERNSLLLSLLIFILVAGVFLPSIRNDFFIGMGMTRVM